MTHRAFTCGRIPFVLAMALASAAVGSLVMPQHARADDCLLDTNHSGVVTDTVDTDGGASSGGDDLRLACGHGANASGALGTAVGANSNASGTDSTALGTGATANATNATAIGEFAFATGVNATAIGSNSTAIGGRSEERRVGKECRS